jgi:TatD DNase family protein
MVRLIDIAVNLTDGMFNGVYHSKTYHKNDLIHVVERAKLSGIDKVRELNYFTKLIITGVDYNSSKDAISLTNSITEIDGIKLYSTGSSLY